MRVLIYEPQFMGHNLVHVARLVRGVAELGCEPIVATSRQAAGSHEFDLHLASLRRRFELLALPGFQTDKLGRRIKTNGLGGAVAVYQGLKDSIETARPEHVYIPYGNFLARTAALPFGLMSSLRRAGAEAETLMVGGRYLYPKRGLVHRLRQKVLLTAIALGPWASVFHLDDAAYDQFQRHGGRMARIGKLLPEPVGDYGPCDRDVAREALGLPAEGRLLAVVGMIERRKGLDPLTQSLRQVGSRLRPDDRLALIGPVHPEVTRLLATDYADLVTTGRIVVVDRRLSEAEMVGAIEAADAVATVYPNHPYASGVLVAAAAAGRPIVGSDSGWIGRAVSRFELGQTCDPSRPATVGEAVLRVLDGAADYRPSPAAERFIEFAGDRNYLALWTERLRQRLGLGPSPDRRTWDWVLNGRTPDERRGLAA